jgi:NAD(P)-dependent dehydrogenase (short-subunit alcohol dehydrogenase family)
MVMKRVLLIGNSGGIGKALEHAFKARGDQVTGFSRSADGFDITDELAVAQGLRSLEGSFDIVFVATGALTTADSRPEKSLSQLSLKAMSEQFLLNAAGPALVLKHSKKLLRKDAPATFATLSARVGSIGDNRLGGWYSYRAAKAALNQIIHTTSIELSRSHPQSICVALHPGTVKTDLTEKYVGSHPAVTPDKAAQQLLSVLETLSPTQTGLFFDWAGKKVAW